MGDRTYVSIQVREIDFEWLKRAEFGDDEERMEKELFWEHMTRDDDIVDMGADECNYGNWDEIEELLRSHLIEYDKTWGDGGEYSGGEAFIRNINGSMAQVDIYKESRNLVDFLFEVRNLSSEEVKARVEQEYRSIIPFDIQPL
jgi:hypothetical protein